MNKERVMFVYAVCTGLMNIAFRNVFTPVSSLVLYVHSILELGVCANFYSIFVKRTQ